MTEFKKYQEFVNESAINEARKIPSKLKKKLKERDIKDVDSYLEYVEEGLATYAQDDPESAARELLEYYLMIDDPELYSEIDEYADEEDEDDD